MCFEIHRTLTLIAWDWGGGPKFFLKTSSRLRKIRAKSRSTELLYELIAFKIVVIFRDELQYELFTN